MHPERESDRGRAQGPAHGPDDAGPDPSDQSDVAAVPSRPQPESAFVPTLSDRLRDIVADPRAAVVVLVAVAVAAGVFWYRTGGGSARDPGPGDAPAVAGEVSSSTTDAAAPTGVGAEPGDAGPGSDEPPTGEIVVHVAGAVATPGVVRVPAGSRVADAVDAAGGAVADADLDRLNLASVLEDGQRILVARRGDPPEVGDAAGLTDGTGSSRDSDDGASGAPIDLNAATPEELESLPGIGPVLAEAIIDERESRGGFRSVNELRDVRGIGEKRFEDLKDRVAV